MARVSTEDSIVKAYREEKLSGQQIASRFGISSGKVTRILDSRHILRRTRSEAIHCLYASKFGKKEFRLKTALSYNEELLKASGVMLYWGEGTKDGNKVVFSNSNPDMIKVFLKFLRVICSVDENRLRVAIHYYEDHAPEDLIAFWSKVTRIPADQFHKPHLHKRRVTGTYRNPSKYGTIAIQYSDHKLLKQILVWKDAYSAQINGPV